MSRKIEVSSKARVQCVDVVLCPPSAALGVGGGEWSGRSRAALTNQWLGLCITVQPPAVSGRSWGDACGKEQRADRKSKWQPRRAN